MITQVAVKKPPNDSKLSGANDQANPTPFFLYPPSNDLEIETKLPSFLPSGKNSYKATPMFAGKTPKKSVDHSRGVQQIHVQDDEEPRTILISQIIARQEEEMDAQSGFQRPPSITNLSDLRKPKISTETHSLVGGVAKNSVDHTA